MNKLRIAFVIPSLIRGGAERQICELIRRIDRGVFEPTLVLFEDVPDGYSHDTLNCDICILNAPCGDNRKWMKRSARNVSTLARLYRCFRKLRPDVVHATLPAAAILGCTAARLAGVPVTIAARRSLFFYRHDSPVLALADRYSLRFVDAVIANCEPIARSTVEVDRYPGDRVHVIENGIDCNRFRPSRDSEVRRRLGWSSDHVVFGMIANFYRFKRHVDFLRAAAEIHRRMPLSRFLLVGRAEGAYAEANALRSELGLDEVVAILPASAEPESAYAAMDVYVSTSETEGMSNVVLEAMACGLPVIATNVGGNPEIVTHGTTGFLVPPFTPAAIAAAGCTLVHDESLRRRFGREASLIAERRFSMERMVRAHETLYTSLATEQLRVAVCGFDKAVDPIATI